MYSSQNAIACISSVCGEYGEAERWRGTYIVREPVILDAVYVELRHCALSVPIPLGKFEPVGEVPHTHTVRRDLSCVSHTRVPQLRILAGEICIVWTQVVAELSSDSVRHV
jgi:hypothetical protein